MSLPRSALWAACACAPLLATPPDRAFEGRVSFYGAEHGQARRRTACGEPFKPRGMTAAHRTLPCGTRLRVTDSATGRSVEVRVNDRGPARRLHRELDLAEGAADALGMRRRGVIRGRIAVLGPDVGRLRLAERR